MNNIKEGDYIQWEPGGVMFFKEPGYVTGVSECGKFVFVSNTGTGLPINECRKLDKMYRVMLDYPGKAKPEWHRFETIGLADDFVKTKLERRDDYALIFKVRFNETPNNLAIGIAEAAYLDNHHVYRRAKLAVAMRDHLNTPAALMAHFRQLHHE